MATISTAPETIAELLDRLGGISPDRVRWQPRPGTAVEEDVERCKYQNGQKHLLELVEGTLVQKVVGQYESQLAVILNYYIFDYLIRHPVGILLGADAGHRLDIGLIRMPDVAFVSQSRLAALKQRPAYPVALFIQRAQGKPGAGGTRYSPCAVCSERECTRV